MAIKSDKDKLKIKVLVVDSDAGTVEYISRLLEKEDYDVLKAFDAVDLFSVLDLILPDILILNVFLPDADGIEICKQLRTDPETENIVLLLLGETGIEQDGRLNTLHDFADDYIIKPLRDKDLLNRIRIYARLKLPQLIIKAEEEKYRLLFESNPLPMWVYDSQSFVILNVNNAAVLHYGYSYDEFLMMSIKDIYPGEELSDFLQVADHPGRGLVDVGIWKHKKKDGSIIYAEVFFQEINYEGRHAILISANDSTRRVKLDALLEIENAIFEMKGKEMGLKYSLELLIKKIEELTGDILCSILFVDEDQVTMRVGPSPSLPEAFKKEIDGLKMAPELEPFGTVVARRKPVIVTDIANDPLWVKYRDLALKSGLKSYWAYPIVSVDRHISGTFSCYYKQIKEPAKNDIELIERAVVIAGILIDQDKAFKRLREKDLQLKEINESLPAAVYQVKLEDITHPEFLFISEGVKQLYGFDPQEIYNDSEKILNLIHPEDRRRYHNCLKASLEQFKKGRCDYRVADGHDHSYKWIRDTFIPIKKEGKLIWNGTLSDITDIKNAQEIIKEQQEWYKALIENSSDAVLAFDEKGIIKYSSPFAANILGFSHEELLNQNVLELVHPDDRESANKTLDQIVENPGQTIEYSHVIQDKGGNIIFIEGKATNLLKQPHVHCIISNFRNITDKVKAREELLESQRKLQESQKIAKVWSYEYDPVMNELKTSPEFSRYFDFEGKSGFGFEELKKIIHPDDLKEVIKKLNDCVQKGRKFTHDFRIILSKGTIHYISAKGKPKQDPNANTYKVFGVLQDITERKRIEKIVTAERAVLELSAKELTLDETLTALIKNLEEISGDMLGSVLFLAENGKTITTGPSPSLPKEYNKQIDGIEIEPEVEPFGTAIFRMEPVIVGDIEKDVLWKDYRVLASKFGLKSYWAFPIVLPDNTTVGTFASYYRYIKEPTHKDIELLTRAVKIAGLLIERDRTTKFLRKSQKLLEEISASIPGVVFQYMIDIDGNNKILFINQGIEKLYGIRPEDVYESPDLLWTKIYHDDLPTFLKAVEESARSLEPWLLEYKVIVGSDGAYKWIRSHAVPEKKKEGGIVWHGTLIDITNVKKAELEIRESEERYRTLFDKNPLSMFVCEKENLKFEEVNNATVNHFGYNYQELLSMKLTDIIFPDDIEKLKRNIKKVEPGVDVEMVIRNITKNRDILYMHVLITYIVYKGKASFLKIATDITEQIQYEETIELQNIYFKELFNASPFGIAMFNKENVIINLNKGFESLFQFTKEELVGKKILENIVPDFLYGESQDILFRSSKEIVQLETKRKKKDGNLVDVLIVRYPIVHNDKIMGYYGMYVDITERKRSVQELRDNEERFRLIIDTALDAVIEIDDSGIVTGWNKQAEIIFGWKRVEAMSHLLSNLIIPEKYRRAHCEGLKRFIVTGKGPLLNKRIQVNALHKNGYEFPIELSIAPVKRKGIFYFSAFARDITEQIRIMDELERSLALSRATLEATADGILVVDKNGKISGHNQRFIDMWNLPLSILQTGEDTKAIDFVLDKIKYPKRFISKIKELYAKPENESFDIIELKDGRTFERYSKPQSIPGKFLGRVWSFRDVTERKKNVEALLNKNKELIKANEELDRFVYSTSHDLRAPLTSVLGLITIVEMDPDEKNRRIYFEKMKSSIRRLDTFIQEIVNYSRNLRLEVEKQEIDIENLVLELIESLRFMVKGSEKIKFNLDISQKITFSSDKARINVLLNNLLSNAIKYHDYSRKDPFINIKIEITKKEADIIIEDNGLGIPKDQQKMVFEMFYRASERSTGSGLGLYIVKEIVNKLKGSLRLKSEEKVGTTFFIRIPNNLE